MIMEYSKIVTATAAAVIVARRLCGSSDFAIPRVTTNQPSDGEVIVSTNSHESEETKGRAHRNSSISPCSNRFPPQNLTGKFPPEDGWRKLTSAASSENQRGSAFSFDVSKTTGDIAAAHGDDELEEEFQQKELEKAIKLFDVGGIPYDIAGKIRDRCKFCGRRSQTLPRFNFFHIFESWLSDVKHPVSIKQLRRVSRQHTNVKVPKEGQRSSDKDSVFMFKAALSSGLLTLPRWPAYRLPLRDLPRFRDLINLSESFHEISAKQLNFGSKMAENLRSTGVTLPSTVVSRIHFNRLMDQIVSLRSTKCIPHSSDVCFCSRGGSLMRLYDPKHSRTSSQVMERCGMCNTCVDIDTIVSREFKKLENYKNENATKFGISGIEGEQTIDAVADDSTKNSSRLIMRRGSRGEWKTQSTENSGLCGQAQKQRNTKDTETKMSRKEKLRQRKWTKLLRVCQNLGKWSTGNRVKIFDDNNLAFADVWKAIDAATKLVWLETYIFDNSPVAVLTADKLAKAASRGCDVVLIVDYIGSFPLKSKLLKDLETAGVTVILFNKPFPFNKRPIGPFPFRDHRKIVVADNVGHCGSLNISELDADPPYGIGKYYDVQMRMEGPCVSHLAEVFLDSLREATRGEVTRVVPAPCTPFMDGVYVQILESNVRRHVRNIQRVLECVVRTASRSVVITQSYFIIPGFLKKALLAACQRGLEVSTLISGASDVPGDSKATLHVLPKLLTGKFNKSRIFLLKSRHCHAKCTVVDGLWSSIGSFNWDRYSARRNLEVVATVFDADVAAEIEALHRTKTESHDEVCEFKTDEWNKVSFWQKLSCRMAYLIAKTSGKRFWDGFDDDEVFQKSNSGQQGSKVRRFNALNPLQILRRLLTKPVEPGNG